MTRRIWRFRVTITDRPVVRMPVAAQILSVGPPRDGTDRLDLWAEVVDGIDPSEDRHLRVVGTGAPLPGDCGRFVGSVATHAGTFVWHVYEAVVAQ